MLLEPAFSVLERIIGMKAERHLRVSAHGRPLSRLDHAKQYNSLPAAEGHVHHI